MTRLTKIYTRSGDKGATSLVGGRRVSKDSPRIWAYGTVDELNSSIGLARALNASAQSSVNRTIDRILARTQCELFNLGAELATRSEDVRKGMPCVSRKEVVAMEKLMDELNKELGPLKEFILPGGCAISAALHQARTICRRAERFCVRLARDEKIGEFAVPYLNRLSDLLFVLARWANKAQNVRETFWQK